MQNEREKHLLWLLCKFFVNRYLIANTHGSLSGCEKAERHFQLTDIYIAWWYRCEIDQTRLEHLDEWNALHEATQELTAYMDEKIGFPIDTMPDYDIMEDRFFKCFHALAVEELSRLELK